jgi:multisubunit Na+/H+ antiporter MnhF subunit
VAILAGLISLYALSATIYRTVEGGWTINRLTIIGWNTINILILIWLTIKQFRSGLGNWVDSAHSAFSSASIAYLVWGLFVVLVIPWLFR